MKYLKKFSALEKCFKVMTVNVRYYRIPYMLHWLLIPFVGTLENTLLGMLNEEMDSNLFAKVLGEIRKFSLIIKQVFYEI